jgi:CHAT domain-containing protein
MAVLLLGLGGRWLFVRQSPLHKGLKAMQLAWRDRRPVEARISSLNYAPWIQTRDNNDGLTDRMARDRAERILLDTIYERPGPAAAHALGRFYLAERKFDQAIEQFEAALKTNANDALPLSDLGAARIEKGKAAAQSPEPGQSPVEFAKAYEHLNRAVELDGALLEALFNRALCLQQMHLPQQAREAWQKYLERDATSAWAEEARRNLRLLEEQQKKTSLSREQLFQNFLAGWRANDEAAVWQAVSQDRNPLDGGVEDRLLDDYLKALAEEATDKARDSLAGLAYLGELLARRTGEQFASKLAAYYSRASAEQRKLSVAGREAMKTGQREFVQSHYLEAISAYQQAQDSFMQAGNECEALLAAFRLGYGHVYKLDRELAEKIFVRLLARTHAASYLWLEFQSLSALAQVKEGRNEYSQAINDSMRLVKLGEKIGDATALARAYAQLAGQQFQLNNPVSSLAWSQRGLALNQVVTLDVAKRWNICAVAGAAFNVLRLHNAALAYQRESLQIAEALQHTLLRSRTLTQIGETCGQIGRYEQAIAVVREAWETGQMLGQTQNGAEIIGRAALQLGHFYHQTQKYPQAIEWYDQSLRLYAQLGFDFYQYPAQKGKLLASYASCDYLQTERVLPVVLQLFEQYREKISKESQRYSFFDQEQSVYDVAIDFEFTQRHDHARALGYAETCRARSLLDLLNADKLALKSAGNVDWERLTSTPALRLPEIQRELPEQVQLLQYAVLKDKALVWLITNTRIQGRASAITGQALTEKVRRFRDLIANPTAPSAEMRQAAQELYQLLVAPLESLLEKDKIICLVPDKALHYLPFQVLIAPATNQYLIERFKLIYAASASTFIAATQNARSKTGKRVERLLSVGNPAFNSSAFPGLQLLLTAAKEAQEVGKLYPPAHVLIERQADESSVRQGLKAVEVAHLATHYLADEHSVLASRLVLAGGAAGTAAAADGALQNSELYQLKLPHARLVVLSACQTGVERSLGGEGALSAARPFLAAGAPLVVASLWPVDSAATTDLMIEFHRQRRLLQQPTVEALRQAQLALLRDQTAPRSAPYYWASFSLFGGYAEF